MSFNSKLGSRMKFPASLLVLFWVAFAAPPIAWAGSVAETLESIHQPTERRDLAGLPAEVEKLCHGGGLAAHGANWEPSCMDSPFLPSARLIWYVISGPNVVAHYETGGIGHVYWVLVADYSSPPNAAVLWRAISPRQLADFEDLLTMFRQSKLSEVPAERSGLPNPPHRRPVS